MCDCGDWNLDASLVSSSFNVVVVVCGGGGLLLLFGCFDGGPFQEPSEEKGSDDQEELPSWVSISDKCDEDGADSSSKLAVVGQSDSTPEVGESDRSFSTCDSAIKTSGGSSSCCSVTDCA